MDYTTTEIIESLKMRGLIPENSEKTFSADELIRFMDEELRTVIVPKIMTVRENFFLSYYDQTLVANQTRYNIHPRAIGMKIKLLFWLDQNGQTRQKLSLTDVDELTTNNWWAITGNPGMYYFQDNFVEILPIPTQGIQGSLRQYFFMRRNQLIASSSAGQIVDISGLNVEINNTPTNFTASVEYDFVKGQPGFQNLAIDQTPTGVSGTVFTFSELPEGLAVGDWLCLAGTSPIPQVPLEIFPVISQTTVAVALMAMNDRAGADEAFKKRNEMMDQSMLLVGTRAENNAKVIVSNTNIGNALWSSGQGIGPWRR